MQRILGISAFYHDSAACLIVDGKIISAAQEERFDRVKHSAAFPTNAIKYCLNEGNLTIDDLDAIVFYEKPFLKFERLLQTYYSFAPKGLVSFLKAIPIWLDEKLFLKQKIIRQLKKIGEYDKKKIKLLFSGHHLSHAASSYYVSPFRDAAILTIDGVGEWTTASISHAKDGKISIVKEMSFPHSVGLLYSSFTYFLGFKVNSGEYKVMGLAPFGNKDALETKAFINKIKNEIVSIKEDGSIWLNQAYFRYATGLNMINEKKWTNLFGLTKRKPESTLEQKHFDLAYAIQHILEEIVIKMAKEARRITKSDNLCMAGGVALNCVGNTKIYDADIFKYIYIQPASGDCGGCLGAALAVHHMYFENDKFSIEENMNIYLGPDIKECEIKKLNLNKGIVFKKYTDMNILSYEIANLISKGNIIGWVQDKMEFGPRALGNRSIFADPRNSNMRNLINQKIKLREYFRPFAPAIIQEEAQEYFEMNYTSAYMMYTPKIKQFYRNVLPDDSHQLTLYKKLRLNYSIFPAVTHIDYTARLQTVSQDTNYKFWQLLKNMKIHTGYPVLLNTSFNVRGEPIVRTAQEAYDCFMSTEMDMLVIQNYVYIKTEQIEDKSKKFKSKFKFD